MSHLTDDSPRPPSPAPSVREERAAPREGLRFAAAALGLLLVPLIAGCDNPLDVDNPNTLVEEDLDDPSAVPAVVNGAQGTLSRTLNGALATYAVTAGELRAIGSRDAWRQLNFGNLADPANEFTEDVYAAMSEARFMADRAVRVAEKFDGEGTLQDRGDLARAYLYAGILYTALGDFYDDFVIPENPTDPAPPIGEENMRQMYDRAVQHLTSGIAVARETGNETLEARLLAQRARTQQFRAMWDLFNPPGSTPSDPLVASSEAAQDAEAALALVGPTSDWEFQFTFTPTTVGGGPSSAAFAVNERGSLAIGNTYVDSDQADPSKILAISLEDPIDGVPDPRIRAKLDVFLTNDQFAPFTVVSARELHLIVAEARLAQGDVAGFREHVNAVRVEMDGLTGWDGQIPALEMLKHERQANLFLENRRLHDLYRFGEQALLWSPTSVAANRPGTFFPISLTEIRSNPQVSG